MIVKSATSKIYAKHILNIPIYPTEGWWAMVLCGTASKHKLDFLVLNVIVFFSVLLFCQEVMLFQITHPDHPSCWWPEYHNMGSDRGDRFALLPLLGHIFWLTNILVPDKMSNLSNEQFAEKVTEHIHAPHRTPSLSLWHTASSPLVLSQSTCELRQR